MPVADAVVDLSVPFHEGMPADDLGPKIWERLGHAYARQLYRNTQSRAGRVFLTTDHTGTHIDGPLRFDPKGTPIEQVPLKRFLRKARLLDLRALGRSGRISAAALAASGADALEPGETAVLWTGHDRHLGEPDYFRFRPELTEDGARALAAKRVDIVAADFPGLGPPGDDRFALKRLLHGMGVMTVEQLQNLDALAGKSWHLFCGPLRVRGAAGSLVRACGLVGWRASALVDLTQEIFPGMPALGAAPTYWTRASHELTSFFYEGELSYQTHAMFLSEHAGTHFDAPYHFDENGPAIDQIPLDTLLVPVKILDMRHKRPLEPIGPDDFTGALQSAGAEIHPGDGVVLWTDHSRNYETRADFCSHRPFITADGAGWLARARPRMVITDLIGLDEPGDLTSPVHNALLRAGVCMLQVATNLDQLVEGEWQVAAFPIKIVEGTGAPLRAFAARP